MSAQFQRRCDEIERLIDQGDFRLAHEALHVLKAESEEDALEIDERERLIGFEHVIPEGSRAMIREARQTLNALTDAGVSFEDFDEATATACLADWRRAMLDGEPDPDYGIMERRVQDRAERARTLIAYREVRREVEALWDEAVRLRETDPNVAVATLLVIYERARDIAREAAAAYPNSFELQALLDNAEARRNHIGGEEEAMTSGALLGDFKRVLSHIERTPEGDYVTIYDSQGNRVGSRPKEEARATILDQASTFANNKASEYLADAENALRNHKPREALAILKRSEDLREFVATGRQAELDELERQIVDAINLLEQAEDIATDARELLGSSSALAAWQRLEEAHATYAGASQAPHVVEVAKAIQRRADEELAERSREIESLAAQERLREAIDLAQRTLDDYKPLGVLGNVNLIRNLQADADARLQQKNTIQQELEAIQQQAARGLIDEAQHRLRELETTHRPSGLLDDTDTPLGSLYSRVTSYVETCVNAQSQLEYLRMALEFNDRRRVENAIENAQQAAEISETHQNEFLDLAEQLTLHRDYLRAKNLASQRQYEAAIELIEGLLAQPNLPAERREELEYDLDDLRATYDEASDYITRFEEAKALLDEGHPQWAYDILRDLDPAPSKRGAHRRLQQEVERKWRQQLEDEIREWDIENPPPVDRIEEDRANLRMLDDRTYRRYEQHILCHTLVREALDEQGRGNWANALQKFQEANREADHRSQTVIRRHIQVLNRYIKSQEKDRLLNDVRKGTVVGDDDNVLWGRLLQMRSELDNLHVETSDPVYAIWSLEVLLMQAQVTPDIALSSKQFTQAGAAAFEIIADLQRTPVEGDYDKRLLELAQQAPAIGRAREALSQNLKPDGDIVSFIEAVNQWHDVFTPYQNDLPFLRTWYEDEVSKLQTQLRQQVSGQRQSEEALDEWGGEQVREQDGEQLRTIEPRARLLILNRGDDYGQAMLEELPTLRSNLESRTERMLKNITTDQVYKYRSIDFLLNQIKRFKDWARYLETASQVLKSLDAELGSEAERLTDIAERSLRRMAVAIRLLTELSEQARDFAAYLDGLGRDRHIDRNEVEEKWRAVLSKVDQLNRDADRFLGETELDFKDHLTVRDLEQQKESLFVSVEKINELLEIVRSMFENEEYSRKLIQVAIDVAGMLRANQEQFKELAANFRVTDPLRRQDVKSWSSVSELIEQRQQQLYQVLHWAAPFGVPQDELTRAESLKADLPEQLPLHVIDAEAVFTKADDAEAQTDFKEADRLLNQVLHGDSSTGQVSLNAAIDHLERPPVEPERADSLRAERIIRAVQQEHLPVLKENLQKAQTRLDELPELIDSETRYRDRFRQGVQEMERAKRGFGVNKRAYRGGYERAQQAYNQMRRRFPASSQVPKMKQTLDEYRI